MKLIHRLLRLTIHDDVFPLFFGILWFIVFFGLLFWDMEISNRNLVTTLSVLIKFPIVLAFFYLWLKAVITDVYRIRRKELVAIPMQVYLVYGFHFFSIYLMSDMIHNNIILRFNEPHYISRILLFDNPIYLWLILNLMASFPITLLFKFTQHRVPAKHNINDALVADFLKSFLFIILASFVILFLSILSL
jgi:hypothetical protein